MTSQEQQRDDDSGTRAPRGRRSPLAVASVAAAVLVVAGGGAYLATGTGDSRGERQAPPAPLALGDTADALGPAIGTPPGPAPGTIQPGEPDGRGLLYRAAGPLPGGPKSARVYRAGSDVSASQVARLAAALGLSGTPRSAGSSWQVGTAADGSGPLLRVQKQAPGTWTFARYAPGGDTCAKAAACGPGGGAEDGGQPVGAAVAEQAAAPVLKAVGQDDAKVDARQLSGATRAVNADPVVGGLPTYGWATGLRVGPDGTITDGGGRLSVPEAGDSYPVIGADQALDELNRTAAAGTSGVGGCATPEPLTGGPDNGAPETRAPGSATVTCAPRPPADQRTVNVEGAVFGLAGHDVDGHQALVPAWLFAVDPSGGAPAYRVTQPAVAPEFLRPALPPHGMKPGSASGGPAVDGGRQMISYQAQGRALTVRFWGGVCGSYRVGAEETGSAVRVRIEKPAAEQQGQVCVAMAKEQQKTVTLDEPLGDRAVVSAATGGTVPRSARP